MINEVQAINVEQAIKVGKVILPNKPLTNFELLEAVKELKIPNFRGVFLRNELPKKPRIKECGILNLDDGGKGGTHWVAWSKSKQENIYFDSFGIQPPLEIIDYLGSPVFYPTEQVQPHDQVFCGHLCLYVLKEMNAGKKLQEIVNDLH